MSKCSRRWTGGAACETRRFGELRGDGSGTEGRLVMAFFKCRLSDKYLYK